MRDSSPLVQTLQLSFGLLKGLIFVLAVVYFVKPGPDQGFFTVEPDEVAFVLRFGRITGRSAAERVRQPGWHYAFPFPIDEVRRVKIKQLVEVPLDELWRIQEAIKPKPKKEEDGGYVPLATRARLRAWQQRLMASIDPAREGYLVTGDNNIVQSRLVIKFQITDPERYLFAAAEPLRLIAGAAYAELIRAVGAQTVDDVLTKGKRRLARTLRAAVDARVRALELGLEVWAVEFKEIVPSKHVMKDFQAVISASIEKQTKIKEARAYANSEMPRARSQANRITNNAAAFARDAVERARGEATSFVALHGEYRKEPVVVRDRLYRQAMEEIFHLMGSRVALERGGEDRLRIFLKPEGR